MENKNFLYNLYYDWWKNIDKFIFSLILLLFFIGLFFSLASTSLVVSDKLDTNDYSFFFKHLIFILLGIITIFFLSSIKQEKLLKFSSIIFIISLISLIVFSFFHTSDKLNPDAPSAQHFESFTSCGLDALAII